MLRLIQNPALSVMARSAVLALSLACSSFVSAQDFADDFARADGPVVGWTVFNGPWAIGGEKLAITNPGGESWIWAGSPPLTLTANFTLEIDVEFLAAGSELGVHHGGIMFCASLPTQRGDPPMDGYTIDWLGNGSGFRLIRWDNGAFAVLVGSTPEIAAPPVDWIVELEGPSIRFSAGGNPVFQFDDGTYRGGHFGAWAYGSGQQMAFDNVAITFPEVSACFTASTTRGGAPLTVDFDASCSMSALELTGHDWDFGDGSGGSGVTISHEFDIPDTYTVTLTVTAAGGGSASTSQVIQVIEVTREYTDDFERGDGPLDAWVLYQGAFDIFEGQLDTTGAGQENWAWAGDPALNFPADFEAIFDFRFTEPFPADGVGRHGGIMFAATEPTWRWGGAQDGYTLDWIDLGGGGGMRLIRWDNGQFSVVTTTAGRAEPPVDWRVLVQGDVITFYGDGELMIQARDGTYRGGHFGVWVWANGSHVRIDNIEIKPPSEPLLAPCFEISPAGPYEVGQDLIFDAACTSTQNVTITGYAWDFGDTGSATTQVAEHQFAAEGVYNVKLTVDSFEGITRELIVPVTISRRVQEFADEFERDNGPADGWTAYQGTWNILDGLLDVVSTGAAAALEPWLWAGSPALIFQGDLNAFLRVGFIDPGAEVGHHGGIMFFASEPTLRWGPGMNGYTIDWLGNGTGFRLIRWDQGRFVVLIGGTPAIPEPLGEWNLEIQGDEIIFSADGVEVFRYTDGAYRRGHFGLWAYGTGGHMQFDEVTIGPPVVSDQLMLRGDCNADGDTGGVTDALVLLTENFVTQGNIPMPFPRCGFTALESDLALGCETPSPACE